MHARTQATDRETDGRGKLPSIWCTNFRFFVHGRDDKERGERESNSSLTSSAMLVIVAAVGVKTRRSDPTTTTTVMKRNRAEKSLLRPLAID